MPSSSGKRSTVLKRHRLLLKASVLSAAAVSALAVAPARAATIVVNNQSQFNAAIAVATQSGHADTIDATTAGVIDSGASLTVPGAATSINLQFGTLGIGSTVGNGTMTLGPTTNVSFGQPGNPGALNMGEGFTGTLNINGAAVIFNVSDANEQFNVGLDGGTGIVNMTSGSVTMNDSTAVPGNFGSLSIGYPFGATAANGMFNQSGGTVALSAGALNIGVANGNGTYNLTNNALLTIDGGTAYIGATSLGNGVLNVSGSATVEFESIGTGGQLFVGDDQGVGTITQNGTNSTVILSVVNNAQFGSDASHLGNPGGVGMYNLMAGTLEIGLTGAAATGGAIFGAAAGGIGDLNQRGGTLIAVAPVVIGEAGVGTYNISAGTANFAAGLSAATLAGSVGTVNQSGGVLTISGGDLSIGAAGVAEYNLSGGVLQVGGTNGIVGTGVLNLGGGTLQVVNSALTTNIPIALTGNNSTIDTNGLGATLGGVISGTGGFIKSGLGTLSLTATDIYMGPTTIAAGTLQIGNGGTSGSILGNVVDNGTLSFDRSDSTTFPGAISGTGGVTKNGAGVLTLSGPGTYTGATLVNTGGLRAGGANVFAPNSAFTIAGGATLDLNNFNNSIGSLAGAGGVTLGSATLATGNVGTSTIYSGDISGTGGLTKVGAGAFTLAGTNTYMGPTNINDGILDVTGTLASDVLVNSGGTLIGNGTIAGLGVGNGGTVAPGNGNSIATLNVLGNVAFAPGSVYQVNVNMAGQSDLIAASGHATLSGGSVLVSGAPAPSVIYTILTAQTGVSGMFSSVAAPGFAFLTPELSYTPTSVLLELQQTRSFASFATTPNQSHVAAALASLPTGSALYQAVLTQTSAAGVQQAFNALSGEVHASTQAVMLDDSRYFRQAMLGRLHQASFDGATGPLSALYSGGPQLAYAEPSPGFSARFDAAAAPLGYGDTLAADFPDDRRAGARGGSQDGLVGARHRRLGQERW
jgi:autotransporter-associated beta strand protein